MRDRLHKPLTSSQPLEQEAAVALALAQLRRAQLLTAALLSVVAVLGVVLLHWPRAIEAVGAGLLAIGASGFALSFWRQRRPSVLTQGLDVAAENIWMQMAVHCAGHALWAVDNVSRRVHLSPHWHQMLGYEVGELGESLDTLDRLVHPDDLPGLRQMRARADAGETDQIWNEHRKRHKDGSYRWVLVRGRVVGRDAQGRALRIAGSQTDIHRRKEAETALESSRKLLESVINLLPNYIYWKNREGVYLGCNVAYTRLIGFDSPQQVVGRTDYELHWGVEIADRIRKLNRAVMDEDRALLNVERESLAWDPKISGIVSAVPLHDEAGRVNGILGVIVDITEIKRTERELRESEERWAVALRSLGDAVWDYDLQRERVYVSPRWEAMLDYQAGEIGEGVGAFESLIHPDDLPLYHQELRRVFEGETDSVEHEQRMRCKGGSYRWILTRGRALLRDADGKLLRFVGTHSDVTDRNLERAELAQARKLEAIGQLAAGIAHEINTPMQFVSDSVHFVRDNLRDLLRPDLTSADRQFLEDQVPRALARSIEGLERVTGIVRAMKNFSRADDVEKTAADINQALESTLVVASNEYKYVADVDTQFGDLPPVPCHIGELNQVFLNLIVNAAHAIGEVVGDSGQRGRIVIRTLLQDDHAVIEVSDSGCGIPPGIQHRIFDPFFTTKGVGKGTGQGLSISRGIVVDKHQGTLSVRSELGRGATFTVRLPLHTAQARVA